MAASTSEYPKVCISPGRILPWPDLQQSGTHKPVFTYMVLVQGKNASERTKIVAKPTRDADAAAMLHEWLLDRLFRNHPEVERFRSHSSDSHYRTMEILQSQRCRRAE